MNKRGLYIPLIIASVLSACQSTVQPGSSRAVGVPQVVRFATFNASLNRKGLGELTKALADPNERQAQRVAAIIQAVRPDVLLLNEFDFDPEQRSLRQFRELYLNRSQIGLQPLHYPHVYAGPSNTGIWANLDLDNDGKVSVLGGDAFGFGDFPGQYGMVLLSRFAIDEARVRSFQNFLWRDLPQALLPDDSSTPEPADWYSPEELTQVRLSSKSHWDVPLIIGAHRVHVLASHPTPPAFEGPERRNSYRNHDEVRFWSEYLRGPVATALYDDQGGRGGIAAGRFVIMGDLNADPVDGSGLRAAINDLLSNPLVASTVTPISAGAVEANRLQGKFNERHRGDAASDTADFNDQTVGNLRVDYVLPSAMMKVCGSGVFWPTSAETNHQLLGDSSEPTSDHRLVWVDVSILGVCP